MVYHLHRQTTCANVSSGGMKSRDKSTVVYHRFKELEHFSYECPVAVPIPVTGDNPNSPANALQSGTNHLSIEIWPWVMLWMTIVLWMT